MKHLSNDQKIMVAILCFCPHGWPKLRASAAFLWRVPNLEQVYWDPQGEMCQIYCVHILVIVLAQLALRTLSLHQTVPQPYDRM